MNLNCFFLKKFSIEHQLLLEKKFLQSAENNICFYNEGSSPFIILGRNQKKEDVLEKSDSNIPVIQRFTGGGTVVVDENTIFITFIIHKKDLNFSYPEEVFHWSSIFYQSVFPASFNVKENDFVFSDLKFGGNALYFTKNKWLLHTSFLWDFDPLKMSLLKIPEKKPHYRGVRSHKDFLTKLKLHYFSKDRLKNEFKIALEKTFEIKNSAEKGLTPLHQPF